MQCAHECLSEKYYNDFSTATEYKQPMDPDHDPRVKNITPSSLSLSLPLLHELLKFIPFATFKFLLHLFFANYLLKLDTVCSDTTIIIIILSKKLSTCMLKIDNIG